MRLNGGGGWPSRTSDGMNLRRVACPGPAAMSSKCSRLPSMIPSGREECESGGTSGDTTSAMTDRASKRGTRTWGATRTRKKEMSRFHFYTLCACTAKIGLDLPSSKLFVMPVTKPRNGPETVAIPGLCVIRDPKHFPDRRPLPPWSTPADGRLEV